jgi:hypothetical protein
MLDNKEKDLFNYIRTKTKRRSSGIVGKILGREYNKDAMKRLESHYELLKKDYRVKKVYIEDHSMMIRTRSIKKKGRKKTYLIDLDFDRDEYYIKTNGISSHPHICSHESIIQKQIREGNFYMVAQILLSYLFKSWGTRRCKKR